MKIYTKTGDTGQTSLYGGERRSKADQRIEAYGLVDEAQAVMGLALAELRTGEGEWRRELTVLLELIQSDCFVICAELARTETNPKRNDPTLSDQRLTDVEQAIDHYDAQLPALRNFIMQGGSKEGATLHMARAVARRAERAVVLLNQKEALRPVLIQYLNRLSDLLFVLARFANLKQGIEETAWKA